MTPRLAALSLVALLASCGPPETPEQAREREAKSQAFAIIRDTFDGDAEVRSIEFRPESGAVCGVVRLRSQSVPLFALRRFALAEGSGALLVTRSYSDDSLAPAFVTAGCTPMPG